VKLVFAIYMIYEHTCCSLMHDYIVDYIVDYIWA